MPVLIDRLIRQGVTSRQIAVVGPASYINGSLAPFNDVEGIPFVSEADASRRRDGILITTARAFKGLEADIVIIYDLTGFGLTFTRTNFYVAWTRARHRLIIIAHGPEIRSLVERTLIESGKVKRAKSSA
jgi:DNA helicase IV